MGYLKERVFLIDENTNNFYVDIAVTDDGEEQWWYCDKSRDAFYAVFLDKENRDRLYSYMEEDYFGETLEDKLKAYLKSKEPKDITLQMVDLFNKSEIKWHPGAMFLPRGKKQDPHVVMSDRFSHFDILDRGDRCKNLLYEMIMNSVEEFQVGNGTTISIRKNGTVYQIEDDGAGIPVEYSDEFKDYEWRRIFMLPSLRYDYDDLLTDGPKKEISVESILHSKFDKSKSFKECPKFSYKHTLPKGEFSPGSTLAHAQCYAKRMAIETVRSNQLYSMEFENGYCVRERTKVQEDSGRGGTRIIWTPSDCCFENIDISLSDIMSFAKEQALLNPGLKFLVSEGDSVTEIKYEGGAQTYIGANTEELYVPIVTRKFDLVSHIDEFENHEDLEISIAFSSSGLQESYHNYRRMKHGSTVNHIIDDVTSWLNNFTSNSLFVINNEEFNGKKFSRDAVEKALCFVVVTHSEYSSYLNEAMVGLDNDLFRAAIKTAVRSIMASLFRGRDSDTELRTKQLFTVLLNKQ